MDLVNDNYDSTNEGIKWDFRQVYVRLVSLYLLDLKEAEDAQNYGKMLTIYKRLHGVIFGRFKKEKEIIDEEFEKRINDLILVSRRYETEFKRMSNDSEGITEIEKAFNELKIYIFSYMEDNRMFGTNAYEDSLL